LKNESILRKRSPKQPRVKNIQGLEESKAGGFLNTDDDEDDGVDTIHLNEILMSGKDDEKDQQERT
jgi:hypothetical protein